MAATAFDKTVTDSKQVLWTLWGVTVGTVPLFGLLGTWSTLNERAVGLQFRVLAVFCIATIVTWGLALAAPRMLLTQEMLIDHMKGKPPPTSGVISIPITGNMSPMEKRLASLAAIYRRPFVFGLLFGELVAVLGLMYVITSAQTSAFLWFGAASLLAQWINRPNLDGVIKRAKRFIPASRPSALPMG